MWQTCCDLDAICKNILAKRSWKIIRKIIGKITGLLREFVFGLSIIIMIVGLFALFMGVIWYFLKDLQLGFYTDTVKNLGEWNIYMLVIGLIVFGMGVWYLYNYFKNRKFVLEEIETNKRSEFLKKHSELKDTVRHLPSKYKKMLKEKEEELRIK